MSAENTTPEERQEPSALLKERAALVSIIETNMGLVFAYAVGAHGELSVEHALDGAVAMFEFGLVLAERHPEVAAIVREASRERDEAKGFPVSTVEAVDAVVRRHKDLLGS